MNKHCGEGPAERKDFGKPEAFAEPGPKAKPEVFAEPEARSELEKPLEWFGPGSG